MKTYILGDFYQTVFCRARG